MIMIFGEITTSTTVNYEQVIRDTSKISDMMILLKVLIIRHVMSLWLLRSKVQ